MKQIKQNKQIKLFKKMILYVARIDKMNNLKDSRPCTNCYNIIKGLGIKKIIYSTDKNDYDICKTCKYKPENTSLGYNFIASGCLPREKRQDLEICRTEKTTEKSN